MNNLAMLTPFIRYALMIFATMLVQRGLLSKEDATALASDPALMEIIVGAITGLATLIWYLMSQSRKAIKQAVGK